MIDSKAFFKMSYGLYIVSAALGERTSGCVVNTLCQVTAEPAKLSVAVNKDNFTAKVVERSQRFSAVALTQSADMELIGRFGFQTSQAVDKFESFPVRRDSFGIPYVTEHAAARYSCRVEQTLDLGSHLLFVGQVEETEIINDEPVLTYDYYHRVIKGGTPKNAPSYKKEVEAVPTEPQAAGKESGYRCSICGYHLESDEIPEGFVCPICGMGPQYLVKL